MEKEIWKDVEGYEGLYQISNSGKVRRWEKTLDEYKTLKLTKDKSKGYYRVFLSKNSKVKKFWIHSLVAVAFLNHKPSGNTIVVDHIDDNKLNNNTYNLRLISNTENIVKGFKKRGTKTNITGVKVTQSTSGRKRYSAFISIKNERMEFKKFDSPEIPKKMYEKAKELKEKFINKEQFKNLINGKY